LSTAIEALTKATNAPPPAADMRSEIRHTEIRAALARMNATDRGKALGQALEENDSDVLAAALNGSRITSGMSKLEIDGFRHRWRHTAHATEMKRLDTLEKAREALMLGGKILLEASLKTASQDIVRAAEKSAAAHRAAMVSASA
jgi:hypothetical protein